MQKIKLNLQFFGSGTINANSTTMPSGTGKVEWSSSVISGKNQSSVTAIVYCRRTSGSGTYCTVSGSVSINGSSKSISKYRGSDDTWNTSWKEVGRYTTTVTHNDDGSKQIPISFTISADTSGLNGTAKGSATVTLDKINRASKLNKIDNFGVSDTATISIDKYVTTAIDTLQIKVGDTLIREVVDITNGYQLTFTDDEKTVIDNLTSAPQVSLIFLLTTVNNNTILGTSTQSAVLTLLNKSLFREIYQKENGKYQVAINGFVNTKIKDVLQVYDDDGNLINNNQILWGPDYFFMHGDQTINLSQKVSEQKNGIVLVWQAYANSEPKFYDFNYTFIPKYHIAIHEGAGITCWLSNSTGDKIATKYVYVYNNQIKGNAVNSKGKTTLSGSGIITCSDNWVLTYVLGV